MHINTRRRLSEFWQIHADAREPLREWYRLVSRRRYADPHELRADFPTASLLGGGKTVFNVAGHRYRLVVTVRYDLGRVFIRHVLTHGDYDRLAAEGRL